MTLIQVWGCLLILTVAPIFGAVLINPWGDRHPNRQLILELAKGVGTIVLTRLFFVAGSPWELLALLAMAMGRYWRCKEAALVAVLGGLLIHDWQITILVGLIGLFGLTLFRQIRFGIWEILALITLALGIRHGEQSGYWAAAIALGGILAWVSNQSPKNQQLWSFFRPDYGFYSLDRPLTAAKVGQDAAILSQIKTLGYPVLPGWLLVAGDDLQGLIKLLEFDGDRPYMVRLSSELPTRRFQVAIADLKTADALESTILKAFTSEEVGRQALLIQAQPKASWSGITYSRPPLPFSRQDPFSEVAPDFITPLIVGNGKFIQYYGLEEPSVLGEEPDRRPPSDVLQEAARLSRQLEIQLGSPQVVEWCFDGLQLWILRVRPVYHLHPVWTREYIAEKFPQPFSPMSASVIEKITRPAIATLYKTLFSSTENLAVVQFVSHHRGYSYLNRSFWERVLRREKLEIPQDQAQKSSWWNYALAHPLLFYRYVRLDLSWQPEFRHDLQRYFQPMLKAVKLAAHNERSTVTMFELSQNLEQIIEVLAKLFIYDLRGQLIQRGRRSLLGLNFLPSLETQKEQALQTIALDIQNLIPVSGDRQSPASLFAELAEMLDGTHIFAQINDWLQKYGDGADEPWELVNRRWQENAGSIRKQITDFFYQTPVKHHAHHLHWRKQWLTKTIDLQQEIEDLSQDFLAQTRWHLMAIAQIWQHQGYLEQAADIFWLHLSEVLEMLQEPKSQSFEQIQLKIQYRRSQFETNQAEPSPPPQLIYGKLAIKEDVSSSCFLKRLQGQAASSGAVIGRVKLCPHWQHPPKIGDRDILVTPYLHENLFPLLSQVKGIITTSGGILSQGASIARQEQIPMVINVPEALQKLRSGQWVRLDGRFGQVELLDPDTFSVDAN